MKHCEDHSKYSPGCPECQAASKAYQAERRNTPTEKLANDRDRKFWGLRSKENWDRFNEMGRRLTECDT